MIAQLWHGAVPVAEADAYTRYLHKTGVVDLENTPGNQGVYILRMMKGEVAHFLMISLWTSLDAISAFAGDDIESAKYYPEDSDYLLELEPTVSHYQVLRAPE